MYHAEWAEEVFILDFTLKMIKVRLVTTADLVKMPNLLAAYTQLFSLYENSWSVWWTQNLTEKQN